MSSLSMEGKVWESISGEVTRAKDFRGPFAFHVEAGTLGDLLSLKVAEKIHFVVVHHLNDKKFPPLGRSRKCFKVQANSRNDLQMLIHTKMLHSTGLVFSKCSVPASEEKQATLI